MKGLYLVKNNCSSN